MTDQADDEMSDHQAGKAEEREQRGIPPEMEEHESKGSPDDRRLKSEVAHGRPDEKDPMPGRKP